MVWLLPCSTSWPCLQAGPATSPAATQQSLQLARSPGAAASQGHHGKRERCTTIETILLCLDSGQLLLGPTCGCARCGQQHCCWPCALSSRSHARELTHLQFCGHPVPHAPAHTLQPCACKVQHYTHNASPILRHVSWHTSVYDNTHSMKSLPTEQDLPMQQELAATTCGTHPSTNTYMPQQTQYTYSWDPQAAIPQLPVPLMLYPTAAALGLYSAFSAPARV